MEQHQSRTKSRDRGPVTKKHSKANRCDVAWFEAQDIFRRSRTIAGEERKRFVRGTASNQFVYEVVMRLLEAHDNDKLDLEKITADAARDVLLGAGFDMKPK